MLGVEVALEAWRDTQELVKSVEHVQFRHMSSAWGYCGRCIRMLLRLIQVHVR